MILFKYTKNTYILKEINHQINLEHLNLLINKILKNRNELDNKAKVNRAIRYLNFVVIGGYASITEDILLELIKQFLNEYNIKFEYKLTPILPEELLKIKKVLPVTSFRKGEQCGGVTADTSSIEPGVEPLCKAISLYNGIETFSSCEGHINNNNGTFYILFTHNSKKDLDAFTLALWESLEKVYEKFPKTPRILLMFDFGHWPHLKCTYFEIRIFYKEFEQDLVFESMKYLSDLLKEYNAKTT